MKRVFIIANTKGGVGKTTIAIHVMSAIFPGCQILEIDDHNRSNIFKKSNFIGKFESIKVKECQSKLEEITYQLLEQTEEVLVIDCGGGDNTKYILNQVRELSLDKIAKVTYIIPVMNSLLQAKNAYEMSKFLHNQKKVFALNSIHNMDTLTKDWLFWFGNESLGLENYYNMLGKPKTILIPHSSIFELASLHKQTISDFARLARINDITVFQKKLFNSVKGDKEKFLQKMKAYRQSKLAKDFIDSFVFYIKNELNRK